MNKLAIAALTGLTLAAVSGAQTITVSAAFAPNASGPSPSYAPWVNNAVSALIGGTSTFGAAGPSRYDNVAGLTFPVSANTVTDFTSFMGSAPGLYAGETGSRLHFPVKIIADVEFTLRDVTVSSFSTDAANSFATSFDLTGTQFGANRRGVFYGADGVLGGGDDVIYNTAGASDDTVLLNELIYVSYGSANQALTGDPGATNQQKIDNQAALLGDYNFSTTYGVRNTGASATTQVNFTQAVPEPATLAVLGIGAAAMLRRRRRKS